MKKPNNYENVQGVTGDFETIRLGGHKCKVISAKEEKSKNGNDMLVIAFDIAEGENKDYFKRRFDEDTREDKKWGGVHRLLLEDKEGNCNKFFKGFITCIENSNTGFTWNWKEEELKGKLFGGIFGREQYENNNGEYKFATKIRAIRSIDNIEKENAPEDKLLAPKKNEEFYPINENIEDDDLPF